MIQPDETFHDEGDEVIEEIRAVRHRISERFGHDPERLAAHYMEKQEQHRELGDRQGESAARLRGA